ncbi:hypothetical protein P8452_24288 [Trifolium repens]|nr:hypothetical protein P8452_24288 [Trifolium repens]
MVNGSGEKTKRLIFFVGDEQGEIGSLRTVRVLNENGSSLQLVHVLLVQRCFNLFQMTNSMYDALALISAVKSVFKDETREKYETFLEVLKDFKAGRIDRRDVKYRVHELFKGHQGLILQFNKFMPTQYEIKLPSDHDNDEQQGRRSETEDALAFLKKVKDAFQGREKYDEFIEILKDSKAGRIDRSVVVERVKKMFEGHTNLILGFNAFLPNTLQIQLRNGGKRKKLVENCEIPWDLRDIISRKLDIDDFFEFAELKSTPAVTSFSHLRLVSCDGQLLVIHITLEEILNVYKIDFSTKNYVKLETLGDIALFYASGEYFYALSNPRMWGYEPNSLHVINLSCTKYIVCVGDDNKLPEYIMHDTHRVPPRERGYLLDWCFKHLYYEVDYSPS